MFSPDDITFPEFDTVEESNLTELTGVGEERAHALFDDGFKSIEGVAVADVEELTDVETISMAFAGSNSLRSALTSPGLISSIGITESGEPIWVTIDFWDHGNVDSVYEYTASELGG